MKTKENSATGKVLKIVWRKFLEQFESPSTRNYRRLKEFIGSKEFSNG